MTKFYENSPRTTHEKYYLNDQQLQGMQGYHLYLPGSFQWYHLQHSLIQILK